MLFFNRALASVNFSKNMLGKRLIVGKEKQYNFNWNFDLTGVIALSKALP